MIFNKYISCSFLIFSTNLFFILSITSVLSENNPPFTSTVWNDVKINSDINVSNESLEIFGNITIQGNGNLEIVDSTVLINPTSNGSCAIIVEAGGSLIVKTSIIESANEFGYLMLLDTGSNSELTGVVIRNCGYYTTMQMSGISVKSDNCTIIDSTIYYEDTGLYLESATVNVINTSFLPNHSRQDGVLEGDYVIQALGINSSRLFMKQCTLYGALNIPPGEYAGAYLQFGWDDLTLEDCKLVQVYCVLGKSTIVNTQISANANSPMILVSKPGPALFRNCSLTNSLLEALWVTRDTTTIVNCTISGGSGDLLVGWKENPYYCTVDLINTPIARYELQNNISVLNFYDYLNVQAIDADTGIGLVTVSVNVSDTNKQVVFSNYTDNSGEILDIQLLSKSMTKKYTDTYTPHRAVATFGNVNMTIDNIDMNYNQNITFRFDLRPPGLNITYPPEGLLTNQPIINVIGDTDTDARLALNGQGIANQAGQFNSTYWLDEGINHLVVKAIDQAGNYVEASRNVTLKTTPPSISIDEPKNGLATNRNPINISGRTNGTKVIVNNNPVHIYPNGTFNTRYAFPAEGSFTITAVAWDDADNNASARVNVEYDITPPSIIILTPDSGSFTNSPRAMIQGLMVGASTATVNGEPLKFFKEGNFSTDIDLVEGANKIVLWAKDIAGNENTNSILLYLDTSNSLEITEPQNNILINVNHVTIRGRSEAGAMISIGDVSVENDNGNFSRNISLKEGLNRITVISVDQANNRVEKGLIITVDTIPPEIVVFSPLDNISKNKDLNIHIKSEPSAIITIDRKSITGTGGDYSADVILVKGENIISITAADAAGNMNSTTLTVSYVPLQRPEPQVDTDDAPLVPGVIIIVIVIAAILGYVWHRRRT